MRTSRPMTPPSSSTYYDASESEPPSPVDVRTNTSQVSVTRPRAKIIEISSSSSSGEGSLSSARTTFTFGSIAPADNNGRQDHDSRLQAPRSPSDENSQSDVITTETRGLGHSSGAVDWVEYERREADLDGQDVMSVTSQSCASSHHGVEATDVIYADEPEAVDMELEDHAAIVELRVRAAERLLTLIPTPPRTPSPKPVQSESQKSLAGPSDSCSSSSGSEEYEANVFEQSRALTSQEGGASQNLKSYTIPQLRSPPSPKEVARAEQALRTIECHACGKLYLVKRMMEVLPCQDMLCPSCFSSALAAVSVTHGPSRCPACLLQVQSFRKSSADAQPPRAVRQAADTVASTDEPNVGYQVGNKATSGEEGSEVVRPIIMRIDNVAWDVTPEMVAEFLPENTFAMDQPQPIHILLDRYDGRTKDYLLTCQYIEVRSMEAVRKILQARQNTFMPGGPLTNGRERPVTITQVHPSELVDELRPKSSAEVHALLSLCQAAVNSAPLSNPNLRHTSSFVAPNAHGGMAHFVKSRHGPFYALMSILSRLRGRESPAYWDLFHIASGKLSFRRLELLPLAPAVLLLLLISVGAIAALANQTPRPAARNTSPQPTVVEKDDLVLEKLIKLFHRCFDLGPIVHATENSLLPQQMSAAVQTDSSQIPIECAA